MDHDGRRRDAQPGEPRLRHARERHDVSTAPRAGNGRRSGSVRRRDSPRRDRRNCNGRSALLLHGDERRRRRRSIRRRSPEDRPLRPRHECAHGQEPRGQGGGRHRDGARQHEPPNSLNADFHFVPTRSCATTRDRCRAPCVCRDAGATATINQSRRSSSTRPAPRSRRSRRVARWSRAPGDLLKPDVIAPGEDILAAVAPAADQRPALRPAQRHLDVEPARRRPRRALLKQLHPDWSPMAVKSALMTSAYDVRRRAGNTANSRPGVIFGAGCGSRQAEHRPRIRASCSTAMFNDWLAFLCGTDDRLRRGTCRGRPRDSIDPSDLNLASIAIGDLAGTQTVHPQGDERRLNGGDVQRLRRGSGRCHGRRQPVVVHGRLGSDRVVRRSRSRGRRRRSTCTSAVI